MKLLWTGINNTILVLMRWNLQLKQLWSRPNNSVSTFTCLRYSQSITLQTNGRGHITFISYIASKLQNFCSLAFDQSGKLLLIWFLNSIGMKLSVPANAFCVIKFYNNLFIRNCWSTKDS